MRIRNNVIQAADKVIKRVNFHNLCDSVTAGWKRKYLDWPTKSFTSLFPVQMNG